MWISLSASAAVAAPGIATHIAESSANARLEIPAVITHLLRSLKNQPLFQCVTSRGQQENPHARSRGCENDFACRRANAAWASYVYFTMSGDSTTPVRYRLAHGQYRHAATARNRRGFRHRPDYGGDRRAG